MQVDVKVYHCKHSKKAEAGGAWRSDPVERSRHGRAESVYQLSQAISYQLSAISYQLSAYCLGMLLSATGASRGFKS
jgi:hypothetical protein